MDSTTDIDAAANELLKGIDIPPQPAILLTIAQEKKNEYPNIKKIAAEISKDVALSAAMLRAANSPAFGVRNKISSISNAVMSLGLNVVFSLVTALCLRNAMPGKGKQRFERFWDTAADSALACSFLAGRFKVMNPDQAYMLGLFHDCGIVLMMHKFSNYMDILKEGNASTEELLTAIEDRACGTNHAVIGYLVARSWFLPQDIRDTILRHHDETVFTKLEDRALAQEVGLLTLAEHCCHSYHRQSEDLIWSRTGNTIVEMLDITEPKLPPMTTIRILPRGNGLM